MQAHASSGLLHDMASRHGRRHGTTQAAGLKLQDVVRFTAMQSRAAPHAAALSGHATDAFLQQLPAMQHVQDLHCQPNIGLMFDAICSERSCASCLPAPSLFCPISSTSPALLLALALCAWLPLVCLLRRSACLRGLTRSCTEGQADLWLPVWRQGHCSCLAACTAVTTARQQPIRDMLGCSPWTGSGYCHTGRQSTLKIGNGFID